MRNILFSAVAAAALLLAGGARAADLSATPVLNLKSQVPATVNSSLFTNSGRGIACMLNQSAHTDTTQSTTFAIQEYDPGTGAYITLVISAAITADATPNLIEVYPQVIPGTLPTNVAYVGMVAPPQFRVQLVETGANSTVTTKVGCISLR